MTGNSPTGRAFVRRLLGWYGRNARDLPWRRTSDPYRIWVSEIMLQQTRVEAVIPYYERFLARYPTVQALAAAPEQDVLEAWSGLGYYRRARFLQRAAKQIVERHEGIFPDDYEAIHALAGIGDYTAAAVAGIAFDQPQAVLDGNVMRLLTRLANDRRDISSLPTKRALTAVAQALISSTRPGERGTFNQALMEMGATICTPRSPRCDACPIARDCRALAEGTVDALPYTSRKIKFRRVAIGVAIARRGNSILMRQRPYDSDIMPGFWELPYIEGSNFDPDKFETIGLVVGPEVGQFKHSITDRLFRGSVYNAIIDYPRLPEYRWISPRRFSQIPVSTIAKKALEAVATHEVSEARA